MDNDKYSNWLAKFLAKLNSSPTWAITLGQTTRYSESEEFVDSHPWWRKHEDCHKAQWARDGYWKFVGRYLWQCATKGYMNIDYEVGARAAANEITK